VSKLNIVTELNGPLTIGKFYLVPCVRILKHGENWLPVLGEKHGDPELGSSFEHYHFDLRFPTAKIAERYFFLKDGLQLSGKVVNDSKILLGPELKTKRCSRTTTGIYWPTAQKNETWLAFWAKYENEILHDCRICPYRGLALKNIVPDTDGKIT
jgi:hypothetical protein